MSTENEKRGLAAKLAEILGDIGVVKKKGHNQHFNYDYFSEAQLMAELRGRFASRGIVILPSINSIKHEPYQTNSGKSEFLVTVETEYVILDAESGEQFVLKGAGMGTDAGDKGVYKATTGAMKYMLMKLCFISDAQDPEAGNGGGESTGTGKGGGHRPTKAYDETKGSEVPTAKADIANLRKWLKDAEIPEEFLIECAIEGKLAEAGDTLDDLKPGVLIRLLKPKAKERVAEKWLASKSKGAAASKKKAGPREDEERGERRTSEHSQAKGIRQPVQTDLPPRDVLEQEGIDNWQDVKVHWGNDKGTRLGDLKASSLTGYWIAKWIPKKYKGRWSDEDILLDAALCVASEELAEE
jgi:hypothetical protein